MVLPIFKPVAMHRILPKDRYQKAEELLAAQIASEMTKIPFDGKSTQRFLEAYFGDLAAETLDQHSSTFESSKALDISRELAEVAFKLLQKVADSSSDNLSLSLLLDAAISSKRIQNSNISRIITAVLTAETAKEILSSIHTATQSSFGPRTTPMQTLKSLARASYTLSAVLQTGVPVLIEQFTSPNSAVCDTTIQIYDMLLLSIANSLLGPIESADWAQLWLRTRLSLLDALHSTLDFLSAHSDRTDRLCEFSFHLSEISHSKDHATALSTASILQDYEVLFKFSERITKFNDQKDDARLETLSSTFQSYGEGTIIDPAIVHRLVPSTEYDKTPLARISELPPVEHKGKGKAVDQEEKEDLTTESVIAHILDILPDQDPSFLRRCLKHPDYQGDGGAERLISSLLEGSVPIDLSVDESDIRPPVQAVDELGLVKERRNIFDDQQIDISSLRLGKKQDNADDLMQDKTWLQEMKAEILRRAEAGSDEEEARHQRGRRRVIPFDEDEFDEFDDSIGDVSVAGDGERSGSDDDIEEKEPTSVETILELTYIENPKLFDRDSGTRKSKARTDLKAKTGWGDEQIEGWRIMLERDPRKNKRLEKHEFRGNKPLPSSSHAEGSGHGRESPAGRGRGTARGRGRGRGGGRGGGQAEGPSGGGRGAGHTEGSTAQDRAWKEKNKSRNRQRGHDKKMTRGGPPAQG